MKGIDLAINTKKVVSRIATTLAAKEYPDFLTFSFKKQAFPSRDCLNFLHAAGLHAGKFLIKPRKF